ncbi:MAG: hypothetical protein ACW99A_06925 [Candidatus Kariarchaeaceae archaeon]|jgi:hypothetical protein
MWKEPKEKSLDAPLDMKKMIRNSIYWNTEGKLHKSPKTTIIQSIIVIIVFALFLSFIIASAAESLVGNNTISNILSIVFSLTIFGIFFWYFYKWAWNSYSEAWYNFDDKDEIFTVIRKSSSGWEIIEIPYEEIDQIEYIEGQDGKAVIKSGPFEFETNRDSEKRSSSVVEIWNNLARTDSIMNNWPIKMTCQKCNRQFGHHIGTAICPFCEIALIDQKAKGRFDPVAQHDDDLDRI